jgi:hypothetical protein
MEHGVPLAIAHVALAARQVAGMGPMEEGDLETRGLKLVVHADPINAGGFHGHGTDLVLRKPLAQGAQFAGEGAKDFDGSVGGRRENLRGAEVQGGDAR